MPLNRPTFVLQPLTDKSGYSQYFFDGFSVKTIIYWLQKLNKSKVVCIGCPRIHERLIQETEVNLFLATEKHS